MKHGGPIRAYGLYGLRITSTLALPGPTARAPWIAEVDFWESSAPLCPTGEEGRPATGAWFRYRRVADGTDYVHWPGLFEFLVDAQGRRIACHRLAAISSHIFSTYLLGQVLSFAMLKQGIDPLHSTAMVQGGRAIGFVGDSGDGKSTLAAAFLRQGWSLLTDDLLVLAGIAGRFVAYPGPPRIKLFPDVAARLLAAGTATAPVDGLTAKAIVPLSGRRKVPRDPALLRALYVLTPASPGGADRITIRELAPRRAFLALTRNTFNTVVVDARRLESQFELATELARAVPVKAVFFPRVLDRLPAVCEAIERDLTA